MNNGLIFLFMFVGALGSALVAAGKNRNVAGWALLGMLFPLISIIIVAALGPVPSDPQRGS